MELVWNWCVTGMIPVCCLGETWCVFAPCSEDVQVQLASAKLAICLKKASFGVSNPSFLQIIYSLLAMGKIHVSVSYIPFMQ